MPLPFYHISILIDLVFHSVLLLVDIILKNTSETFDIYQHQTMNIMLQYSLQENSTIECQMFCVFKYCQWEE